MSEGNWTPTRRFVEIGESHVSVESTSEAEDNLLSQLTDRKLSSNRQENKRSSCSTRYATRNTNPVDKRTKLEDFHQID